MKQGSLSREQIRELMAVNAQPHLINPLNFDWPPPIYDDSCENGWTAIAKAIISKDTSLAKFIKHAKRWKRKQYEWKWLPFLSYGFWRRSKSKRFFGMDSDLIPVLKLHSSDSAASGQYCN